MRSSKVESGNAKSRVWIVLIALALIFSLAAKGTKPEVNQIESVELTQVNQLPQLVITTTYPATYSVYRPLDPVRVIVDLADCTIKKGVPVQIPVNNGIINVVKLSEEKSASIARVEIGLDKMMAYAVSRENNKILVNLAPDDKTGSASEQDLYGGGKVIVENKSEEPQAEAVAPEEELAPSPGTQTGSTIAEIPSGKVAGKLLDIIISELADRTQIIMVMDGNPPDYNAFPMKNPARLVVDLWKVKSLYPGKQVMINSQGIKQVRIGQHTDKLRLVFDGSENKLPSYNISRQEERLILTVSQSAEVSVPGAPVLAAPLPEAGPAEELPPAAPAPTPGAESAGPLPGAGRIKVLAVDFKYTPAASIVEIKTDQSANYEKRENLKDLVFSLVIKDASIPAQLERTLDTSEFQSPVKLVSSFQATLNEVSIVVNLNNWVVPEIKQEGNKILLSFPNPGAISVAPPVAGGEEIAPPSPAPAAIAPAPAEAAGQPVKIETLTGYKVYTGTPITIEAKNLDILDALRAIAQVSGKNIITSDDVSGRITLRLENVPWDQALDLILDTKDLGMVQYGNVIRVAPNKDIQKAQEDMLKSLQAKEKLRPLQTRIIPINYARVEDIEKQVKNVLSDRGKTEIDKRTSSLIIKDIPEKIQEAEVLIKALDTRTPQVLIEARIVEASLGVTREIGVQWGVNYNAGPAWGNPTGLNFPNTIQTGGAVLGGLINSTDSNVLNTAGAQGGAMGISFGSLTDSVSLDLLLKSLETQNKVKIISSPRIMTMDNEKAYIQQGVTIPYPPALNLATGAAGGQNWQFVEAALRLEVTPHISPDGSMVLELKASNNEPNLKVVSGGAPSIDKKEAQTQIVVKDGETIVIGGIYKTKESETVNQTPYLSKIPILGKLFQDKFTENSRNELLIFLTPRIVN